MSEIWRTLPGYEGLYEVSDQGRVRSLDRIIDRAYHGPARHRGRVLKPVPTQSGHLTVGLYLNTVGPRMRPIHQLVLEAFVGPRPSGLQVRHLDGDPTNNHVSNLAYGTRAQNTLDSVRHGTHPAASRTHCVHGHAFDDENTARTARRRTCRACNRRKSREYYARQKQMASPS